VSIVAANIKKGVSIFGVTGNADGDMTFKKNDVSTVGGNYSSQHNLKLVEFTPYTYKYTVSTPVGSQEVTAGLSYNSGNRTLFFLPAEAITNVVFLKEIQYSHGSSGYMGFRTEPQFAWNAPNLSVTVTLQNSTMTISGDNKLCLFFPNPSANGEYGNISVKKILAYCY